MSNESVIHESNEVLASASFEERSVWVQLMALVAVLGSYFVVAVLLLSKGVTTLIAFVPLVIAAVVLLVVVLVVGHIVVAIASRPEGRDERDRLIEWRAESGASWILGVGILAAIAGLIVSVDSVWIAHVLLLAMLVSEVAKLILQLVYYRRGMQL